MLRIETWNEAVFQLKDVEGKSNDPHWVQKLDILHHFTSSAGFSALVLVVSGPNLSAVNHLCVMIVTGGRNGLICHSLCVL